MLAREKLVHHWQKLGQWDVMLVIRWIPCVWDVQNPIPCSRIISQYLFIVICYPWAFGLLGHSITHFSETYTTHNNNYCRKMILLSKNWFTKEIGSLNNQSNICWQLLINLLTTRFLNLEFCNFKINWRQIGLRSFSGEDCTYPNPPNFYYPKFNALLYPNTTLVNKKFVWASILFYLILYN